ncbi:unnamed protein product [Cylindrotheca closterium]|uniref:Auxin efflux carrier component n=1 Tax=Cylindrotheca closterium TaxID=2856 RepID=A0AAD2CIX0_9STRA|nr:unnamed protein product [Cylindrotheca closterium]
MESSDFDIGYESAWIGTFSASLRSVGTACTLATVGIYLHRRGFLKPEGKRTLALISQQVTIPLLFFTKIIYCNQDWSTEPCPDVIRSLRDVWMLLWWPLYVVGSGLIIGYFAAKVSKTPPTQVRGVMAACGFGNSTGLPITLLTVVHANFPDSSDLGKIDPCLFLTVYLLLYPVLQWGIGGWLLSPETSEDTNNDNDKRNDFEWQQNVLNQRESSSYTLQRRGMNEVDASMYISVQESLDKWGRSTALSGSSSEEEANNDPEMLLPMNKHESFGSIGMDLSKHGSSCNLQTADGTVIGKHCNSHNLQTIDSKQLANQTEKFVPPMSSSTDETSPLVPAESHVPVIATGESNERKDPVDFCGTLSKIAKRCMQPPVIGALLGILVASFPALRGILVDLEDRTGDAPMEWFFDGLYEVGQAAVPLNMMILGSNLSGSSSATVNKTELFSGTTTVAIVIAKMIVMPIFGILSVMFFREYYWTLPDDIAGSFYLVAMIVFLTPTANNVMVMVELSGSGSKQGLARVIAWQYAVSPILLSLTMTVAVGLADKW